MAAKKASKPKRMKATLPKGFVEARTRLDGFFQRELENSVTGVLRGSFKTNGKFGEKNVFRIEVTEGETLIDEGELVGPGGVVGLDETGYTSALADLEAGTKVFVRYDGLETPDLPPSKTNPHLFTVGKGA